MIACAHAEYRTNGKDRHGNTRYRCKYCGKTWVEVKPVKTLGEMRILVVDAKLALRILTEGMSVRATERTTGFNRNTLCKMIVVYGDACRRFLDRQMRGLTLGHLQFDEQRTWVGRKQARLTFNERQERFDVGDVYIWTCIDQKTKLMPSFMIGSEAPTTPAVS